MGLGTGKEERKKKKPAKCTGIGVVQCTLSPENAIAFRPIL